MRWISRLPLGNLSSINIDTNTLEFKVHRNQVSAALISGFPLANRSIPIPGRGSMWKLFAANRPCVCLADIPNKEQLRVCRRLNQALCLQSHAAAWGNKVLQREVHAHPKPQRLLPSHSQVTIFITNKRGATLMNTVCVYRLCHLSMCSETTWRCSTRSCSMDAARRRVWKWRGSLQGRAARWGLRWLRLCWRIAPKVRFECLEWSWQRFTWNMMPCNS